ncbi:hypothetical protein ABZS66_19150 [Dactylosporangium sp. NPDC005572]|uniref:hypothetical protein n=1 Tax=Dactylosporangium sp. NPDC005572 TaxID=3156889 RepID=UPI0033B6123B
MTLYHDRAQAALDSLRAALDALSYRVGQALVWARSIPRAKSDGLRSPRYGTRGSTGGHGDPTAGVLIGGVARAERQSARAEHLTGSVTDTLRWIVRRLQLPTAGNPLDSIEAALPTLQPATCAELTLWLVGEDGRIRAHLGELADYYDTAEGIAARLTTPERPIDAARIRDWARRARTAGDRLYGLLPAVRTGGPRTGNSWYRFADAELVAGLTARQKTSVDNQAA